jgi:hypothetical protein
MPSENLKLNEELKQNVKERRDTDFDDPTLESP